MTAVKSPTLTQIRGWPPTVDVGQAALALGISRSTAYELVRSGEFPCRVLSVRRCHRVVTASLIRLLSAEDGEGGQVA